MIPSRTLERPEKINQVTQNVEIPQIHHSDKMIDVPVVCCRGKSQMSKPSTKTLRFIKLQFIDKICRHLREHAEISAT